MYRRELVGIVSAGFLTGCLRLTGEDQQGAANPTPAGNDDVADDTPATDEPTASETTHGAERTSLSGEWPQLAFDAANIGFAPEVDGPVSDVSIAWTTEMREREVAQNGIAVADGVAYVPDVGGYLDALDLHTGERQWHLQVGGGYPLLETVPAVHRDRVFVTAKGGQVTAVGTGGRRIWEYQAGEPPVNGHHYMMATGVTPRGDTVYFGSGTGAVSALAVDDGRVRWETDVGAYVGASAPAVTENGLFIGDLDGRLHALTASGAIQWSTPLGDADAIVSSPAYRDGRVYVGSVTAEDGEPIEQPNTGYLSARELRGGIHAVDAESGEVAWSVALPDVVYGSPAVTDELVVSSCWDANVYAYTLDGSRHWFYSADGGIDASPAIAGTTVYFGGGRAVYGVAVDTGRERWRVEVPSAAHGTPAVVTDGVVIGDHRDEENADGGNCYLLSGSPG